MFYLTDFLNKYLRILNLIAATRVEPKTHNKIHVCIRHRVVESS